MHNVHHLHILINLHSLGQSWDNPYPGTILGYPQYPRILSIQGSHTWDNPRILSIQEFQGSHSLDNPRTSPVSRDIYILSIQGSHTWDNPRTSPVSRDIYLAFRAPFLGHPQYIPSIPGYLVFRDYKAPIPGTIPGFQGSHIWDSPGISPVSQDT